MTKIRAIVEGGQINLDGAHIKDTNLHRCHLVYGATDGFTLENVDMDGCTFELTNRAADVVHFLKALYGNGAATMIEELFDQIRGKPRQHWLDQ